MSVGALQGKEIPPPVPPEQSYHDLCDAQCERNSVNQLYSGTHNNESLYDDEPTSTLPPKQDSPQVQCTPPDYSDGLPKNQGE